MEPWSKDEFRRWVAFCIADFAKASAYAGELAANIAEHDPELAELRRKQTALRAEAHALMVRRTEHKP